MVKTSPSNVSGAGLIPGLGAKIPHASRLSSPSWASAQGGNQLRSLFIPLIFLEPFLLGEISGLCGNCEW